VNGHYQSANGAHPQPSWGAGGPQPQGTIYIGFDQPVQVAPHPQAAYGVSGAPAGAAFNTPQHTGYRTAQNGWFWNRRSAAAAVSDKPKKSSNTLGLVGFVVSLCGLATGALPVAVAGGSLSTLGLFRRGRFLALTGLVLALANPAVVQQLQGDGSMARLDRRAERIARVELQKQLSQVNAVLAQAEGQILAHYEAHGQTWPDGIEGNMLVAGTKDPWGNALRFDEMGDRLVLRSLGPDRKAETGDDVVLNIQHFRGSTGGRPSGRPSETAAAP